ncbi:MAG: universal stress protein [Acidimicrobiales bacterium]
MFQSIVVGTDGSPSAGAAVAQAVSLARTCGAKMHLVTAYRPIEAMSLPPEVMPANIHEIMNPHDDAMAVLNEAAGKAKADGVEVDLHACAGDPAGALIEVAEAVGADCIVVGNRGMTGKSRFLLGSVPNKVSHHAPCSLLIVRTS